jgi:hypothetical protein
MIINPHSIPDLGLKFDRMIAQHQVRYLVDLHSNNIKNNNVYYSYFRHECGIQKLLPYIGKDTLTAIKQRKVLLAIDFNEARYEMLDEIYNHLIIKEGIPPEQILLVGASPDLKNAIISRSRHLDINPIRLEVFYLWEKVVKEFKDWHTIGTFDSKKTHNKVYINLNHFFRVHRAYLMANLEQKNLLGHGYNSFHNAMDGNELVRFKELYPYLPLPETRHLDVKDDKTQISGGLSRQFVTYKIDTLPYYVNDSMVHIVGETQFFGGPRDLSEKTFKPIFFKQPFIFVGQPRCLELLRQLGYKTFHGLIDESYDTVEDHQTRLDMIIEQIERLCKLTDSERIEFTNSCIDIVEHNYDVLMSKTNYIEELL